MPLNDFYSFRGQLLEKLRQEIVGPTEENEILTDPPITQYLAGILFPQDVRHVQPDAYDDEPASSVEEMEGDGSHPSISLAHVRYPSSMGLTFAVDGDFSGALDIEVASATYFSIEDPNPESGGRNDFRRQELKKQQWQRVPIRESVQLRISDPNIQKDEVVDGLLLITRVRERNSDGSVPVTVSLVNTHINQFGQPRDGISFYQPIIAVRADDGSSPFVDRHLEAPSLNDDEVESYRLLFRHVHNFGIGHGCSVMWESDDSNPGHATLVQTSYTPDQPVKVSESNPKIDTDNLSMISLANGDASDVIHSLTALCDGYKQWIEEQKGDIAGLSDDMQGTARGHMISCEEAAFRLEEGVTLLASDQTAMKAFQLANLAMLHQRARTQWLGSGDKASRTLDIDSSHVWRPFQIAFVLTCIGGIVDPNSENRRLVDLLWFPTGGGKTEAYLALIAFSIFYRRLVNNNASGVTAFMRYTLRLLTIQQFQRASLLICCCEDIRKNQGGLGDTEITVGLWVGEGATPNSREDARQALFDARRGTVREEANPMLLESCIWCGSALGTGNYFIADAGHTPRPRMVIRCNNDDCSFKTGLPVYLIDDDIFDYRPTLLVATADKYASLPWVANRANVFNLEDPQRNAPRDLPPVLIIQDELHLISGPLGTLTGLYETIVNAACSEGENPPKEIASTATIRRAKQQGHSLFGSEVRQFPPPGLDSRNSYFAVEAPSDNRGDRLYVGLMAPGRSHQELMIRTYAVLLQYGKDLAALDSVRDPYWTLVGYFNALRVLGGARIQVTDDVDRAMERLAVKAGGEKRDLKTPVELNSRASSAEVRQHLRDMPKEFPDPGAMDVIMATNMISVGVDIDRLGLMVMMGQPQSTSEYIQATSRVGRQFPGLVVAVYNCNRSRDRSHYESFASYHSALYRQVESTSVTPFSPRARDRALHAVLIAMARLLVPNFRANDGAASITSSRNELTQIVQAILDRVSAIAPAEYDSTRNQLNEILVRWEGLANYSGRLLYNLPDDPFRSLMIHATGDETENDSAFPTIWSLRDVDKNSSLYLI